MLRDNFKTSTWILIGACLQSLLLLYLPGTLGLAPAFLWLGWRIADPLLMMAGIRRNIYMDGVIPGKWAVQFPDKERNLEGEPAEEDVCLIFLGARSNHPLGMFAPGYKDIADYFNANIKSLEADPESQGWLGGSGFLNGGDRSTSSEIMMIGYFKNVDYLHKFAHGETHREGWKWWNRIVETHPYLSLMHEVYQVPRKSWEGIYVNYHPTGLAATSHPITNKDGTKYWTLPIVDAQKGRMKTSLGRMGRSDGGEHVQYGDDPYEKV